MPFPHWAVGPKSTAEPPAPPLAGALHPPGGLWHLGHGLSRSRGVVSTGPGKRGAFSDLAANDRGHRRGHVETLPHRAGGPKPTAEPPALPLAGALHPPGGLWPLGHGLSRSRGVVSTGPGKRGAFSDLAANGRGHRRGHVETLPHRAVGPKPTAEPPAPPLAGALNPPGGLWPLTYLLCWSCVIAPTGPGKRCAFPWSGPFGGLNTPARGRPDAGRPRPPRRGGCSRPPLLPR